MLLFSESLPLDCEPPGGSEFFVISALEIVTAYNREGRGKKGMVDEWMDGYIDR